MVALKPNGADFKGINTPKFKYLINYDNLSYKRFGFLEGQRYFFILIFIAINKMNFIEYPKSKNDFFFI